MVATELRWIGSWEPLAIRPRTQILEYTAGTLTTTRDFRYQGDAIVQELTNTVVTRDYLVDATGSIVRFCDPNCVSPTATYLVTWNGHGDALAAWRIESDGTLALANSYTYSTWGAPTTTVASGFSDLGLRFLYVGQSDVQWDNFSGLGLYYMHAHHFSPTIGRFLQPDPSRLEQNAFTYVGNNPATRIDPTGLVWMHGNCGGVGFFATCPKLRWADFEIRIDSTLGPLISFSGLIVWFNKDTGASGVKPVKGGANGFFSNRGGGHWLAFTGPGRISAVLMMTVKVFWDPIGCTALPNWSFTDVK